MGDASSLGVTPASSVTTQLGLIYNSVFPSIRNATFIGGLSQNSTDINVLSQLDKNISKDFYTFNLEQGNNLKLSFNSVVGINSNARGDTPGTATDGVSAGLRYQLYDITGNVIADSAGTPAQQAAYANLTSSSGLSAVPGGYTVQVSAAPGTTLSSQQAYNFQLYSGTTYSTSLIYSAQTQSYDPNLFVPAQNSVAASTNNVNLYTNSATLSGTQASALNIGNLINNKTDLSVTSQINNTNPSSYYNFDFKEGTSLKLNLNNTTSAGLQSSLRVQLSDSRGKVVADNYGTDAQQIAYKKLASGEGLATANGNYTVKVSYAPGALTGAQQNYNFQIYSGTSYDTTYQTTAILPSAAAAGKTPDVGIFANSQAQLFARTAYHTIGETADTGVNIGWITQNQSALNVISQLSHADSKDYYSFTLQQGSNLKLAFDNQTNTAATRVQLLDATGTQVIADNHGSSAQQQAFKELTSPTGLKASPQQYAIQVSYAPNADTTKAQTYDFQVYSGESYLNLYKTTASAQTYQNALLSGNTSVVGYNPASAAASYFNNYVNGANGTLIDLLSSIA